MLITSMLHRNSGDDHENARACNCAADPDGSGCLGDDGAHSPRSGVAAGRHYVDRGASPSGGHEFAPATENREPDLILIRTVLGAGLFDGRLTLSKRCHLTSLLHARRGQIRNGCRACPCAKNYLTMENVMNSKKLAVFAMGLAALTMPLLGTS